MEEIIVNESIIRYSREFDRYKKLSDLVYQICLDLVQNKLTMRATVQRRAKSIKSLQEKLRRNQVYKTVDDVFNNISDLAGVRIITYLESDRENIIKEIKRVFAGKDQDNKPVIEKKDKTESGRHYRATHCQIYLPEEYFDDDNSNLRNTACEIQICSSLAHVFNEIEHDLQYKPLNGGISDEEHELLDQLGLITKSGDLIIKRLLEATDERLKLGQGEFGSVHDFVIRMQEELKFDLSFSNNAVQLYEEFRLLNLTTPQNIIKELIQSGESLIEVSKVEYEKFKKYITDKNLDPTLEDKSSDILLAALLRKFADEILSHQQINRVKGRQNRLVQLAKIYKEMPKENEYKLYATP